MAYDPVKAHEYYEKYRKKGLKKGRKKGKKKNTSSKVKKQNLLGLSTSGLNDAGKMNWAMAKKDLQDQMNADLAKATTDEQKAEIRADYQGKALKALQDMKKDPSFAQAKSSKSGSKSGSKSSNKNDSKSGSKNSGSTSNKSNKSKGSKTAATKSTTSTKAISHGSASTAARIIKSQDAINAENAAIAENKAKKLAEQKAKIEKQITELRENLKMFSDEEKHRVKTKIQKQIETLRKRLNSYG